MSEDLARKALQALAEHDRLREAPAAVEEDLMFRFRAARLGGRKKSARRVALGTGTLAAALGTIATLLWTTRFGPRAVPQAPTAAGVSVSHAAPSATTLRKAADRTGTAQKLAASAIIVRPKRTRPAQAVDHVVEDQAVEVVTDFYPLLDPAPPFERGQILRVQLPASVMRAVGLPVREERLQDPIQADVVVGEEGLARAIRFVKFQSR